MSTRTAPTPAAARPGTGWHRVDVHLADLHTAAGRDVLAPLARRVLQTTLRAWRAAAKADRAELDRGARAGLNVVAHFAGTVPTAAALGVDDRTRAHIVHLLVTTGWLDPAPGAPGRYRPALGTPIGPRSDPSPSTTRS